MKADDLIKSVEELKVALLAIVTGGNSEFTDAQYSELRKVLTRHPDLGALLPEWLRRGSSLAEVNSRIRRDAGDEGGKWQRRREIVTRDLDAILDVLEDADSASAASLDKLELLGRGRIR